MTCAGKLCYSIPPDARIIPNLAAVWNMLKGGSDTITKLDKTYNTACCLNISAHKHVSYVIIAASS